MTALIQYVVTVKAIVERTEKAGQEWKILSSTDSKNEEYGYTPVIEKVVKREEVVYEQTVSNLNMAKLVQVVNGLDT